MATTEWRPVLAFPMGPSPPAPLPEAGRGGKSWGELASIYMGRIQYGAVDRRRTQSEITISDTGLIILPSPRFGERGWG